VVGASAEWVLGPVGSKPGRVICVDKSGVLKPSTAAGSGLVPAQASGQIASCRHAHRRCAEHVARWNRQLDRFSTDSGTASAGTISSAFSGSCRPGFPPGRLESYAAWPSACLPRPSMLGEHHLRERASCEGGGRTPSRTSEPSFVLGAGHHCGVDVGDQPVAGIDVVARGVLAGSLHALSPSRGPDGLIARSAATASWPATPCRPPNATDGADGRPRAPGSAERATATDDGDRVNGLQVRLIRCPARRRRPVIRTTPRGPSGPRMTGTALTATESGRRSVARMISRTDLRGGR
jgi:hypothetical protein